jgi:hypothetical protein
MKRSLRQFVVILTSILISASVVNAQVGGGVSPEPKPNVGVLSEDVVRARLSSAGYGEIQSIKREGQYYVIKTVRNGHSVYVKVHTITGQISEGNG